MSIAPHSPSSVRPTHKERPSISTTRTVPGAISLARATVTTAQPVRRFPWSAAFAQRVSDNLGAAMEARLPGWRTMLERWREQAKSKTP